MLYHYIVTKTDNIGGIYMCLACSIAENAYAKNEKQADYSASEEYNSSTY